MPLEVTGDSARGDAYAFARLVVDGERIVEADAPGMAGPLVGLTLLEAAAVPGETLAADAVANALAQVIRAAPSPGRVAVAMSGGVDSAVTLLRARPDAVGVTLRLWLDPAGPDSERACCSPDAVIRARETCHALGLPHVTLDLREAFRNTVVRSFVDGYASGVTPNPCMRCNGAFRFAALVGFAEQVGARRAVDRALRRGSSSGTVCVSSHAVPTPRRISRTCWRPSIRRSWPASHSLSGRRRRPTSERRQPRPVWRRRRGRRARRRASSRAATTDPSLLARGSRTRRGRSSTRAARSSVVTTGCGGIRPASVAGSALRQPEPLYALRTDVDANALVVGPRRLLGTTRVEARGRLYLEVDDVEAKLRYRSPAVGARVSVTDGGFSLELAEPVEAVAPGQVAVLYDGDVVVGAGVIERATG